MGVNGFHVRASATLECCPLERRHQYSLATIGKWLEVFLKRFFEFSQFKRSRLAETGRLELCQRRNGNGFDYLAQKRKDIVSPFQPPILRGDVRKG